MNLPLPKELEEWVGHLATREQLEATLRLIQARLEGLPKQSPAGLGTRDVYRPAKGA